MQKKTGDLQKKNREVAPAYDFSDSDNLIRRDRPREVDRKRMNMPKTSAGSCGFRLLGRSEEVWRCAPQSIFAEADRHQSFRGGAFDTLRGREAAALGPAIARDPADTAF
jgi:hypothetical protein